MDISLKTTLWQQFGASIDMLGNAVSACPDSLWDTESQYWYNAYHVIFYLDYYLSDPDNFMPPAPFTLSEFNPDGELPERVYSQSELLDYIGYCKKKCHDVVMGLTPENMSRRFTNPYRDYSIFEILLYNMRHVQHHAGQLNLLLRQNGYEPPRWVSQTKVDV